jgi:hypothetical protein
MPVAESQQISFQGVGGCPSKGEVTVEWMWWSWAILSRNFLAYRTQADKLIMVGFLGGGGEIGTIRVSQRI